MNTFHIHFQGIVQGVGFRPFVYKYAKKLNLHGWVNNTDDGVHIHINAGKETAERFMQNLLENLPPLAVVTHSFIEEVAFQDYTDFEIVHSENKSQPNLLLTPDVGMCADCRRELYEPDNRRYQYPFITCTNCGPRYSIITGLPYDRPKTTMAKFEMCPVCLEEYNNPMERRHFSQTNSCPDCAIEMQVYEKGVLQENFTDLDRIVQAWQAGKIIAIKGIGGYLLTCDATQKEAVQELRKRKRRPVKPFALMYPDLNEIQKDVWLSKAELAELTSISSPIVLLETKKEPQTRIALEEINKGLSRLGIMLPYTPLYDLLLQKFKKPIVATSGNLSDSTIVYKDKKAIEELSKIADMILLNNRKIVIPQDDGVVQFSKKHRQKIVLRRSRGKAPTYINPDLQLPKNTVFAAGSMLKSTFGIANLGNVYISQYLGNTEYYEAQLNYQTTFLHLKNIFQLGIEKVVVDKHPDYFATRFGREIATDNNSEIVELQHHKAHLYAVLGENNLLDNEEPILGIVWDGTGLGDDGNIWGGEFFKYENHEMERVFHLDPFPFIVGDKMVKEPRISALAIAHKMAEIKPVLKNKFTDIEWNVYQKLLQKTSLQSTSMGRLFDAVSSLLLGNDIHHFDAEASIRLEQISGKYYYNNSMCINEDSYLKEYKLSDNLNEILLKGIWQDIKRNEKPEKIGAKFHLSLIDYMLRVAGKFEVKQMAFSGGVFQNALLVDMILDYMSTDYQLYFHKEFSPNDEGIPFGQLVYVNNK